MAELDPKRIEVGDGRVAEILRRKKPRERLEMAIGANRTARALVKSAVRSCHPDWDDAQVNREVARRMLSGAG